MTPGEDRRIPKCEKSSLQHHVVLLREDIPEHEYLTGYPVTESPAPPHSELRAFMRRRLPDYMVPSAFIELDALPLTPNGKIAIATRGLLRDRGTLSSQGPRPVELRIRCSRQTHSRWGRVRRPLFQRVALPWHVARRSLTCQPDTPHQSTNRQAMVSVAVSNSVMETCSSGQWAQPMSPAPYMTHGMFARCTKNRMSAP